MSGGLDGRKAQLHAGWCDLTPEPQWKVAFVQHGDDVTSDVCVILSSPCVWPPTTLAFFNNMT